MRTRGKENNAFAFRSRAENPAGRILSCASRAVKYEIRPDESCIIFQYIEQKRNSFVIDKKVKSAIISFKR